MVIRFGSARLSEDAASCLVAALQTDDAYLEQIAAASLTGLESAEVESEIESVLETVDEDTEVHALAFFVQSALQNTAAGAKKSWSSTHISSNRVTTRLLMSSP